MLVLQPLAMLLFSAACFSRLPLLLSLIHCRRLSVSRSQSSLYATHCCVRKLLLVAVGWAQTAQSVVGSWKRW